MQNAECKVLRRATLAELRRANAGSKIIPKLKADDE